MTAQPLLMMRREGLNKKAVRTVSTQSHGQRRFPGLCDKLQRIVYSPPPSGGNRV